MNTKHLSIYFQGLVLESSPDGFKRISTWDVIPLGLEDFTVRAFSEDLPKRYLSGIYQERRNVFSEGVHVKNWWQPEKGDKNPFIQLNLNNPGVIKTVYSSEQIRNYTVQDFSIETQDENGKWTAVYRGKYVGIGLRIKLSEETV